MKAKIQIARHAELPLNEDKANFFLQISTAISVFLFSIALAAYFMTSSMISSWNKNIVDGLTVQIMPPAETLSEEEELLRTNKVISFFEGLDGVLKVRKVSNEQIQHLMAPWLGKNADIESLPMPKLLDVRLKDGKTFDFEKASDSLKEFAPYASIDNHGLWLKKLIKSAGSLKILSLFVLALVLGATVFSLFYAVETSLKVHQNIVEILHVMGATDSYIAKQYAIRALKVGFVSSLIGIGLGFLALFVISHLSSGLETGLIGAASLNRFHWIFLFSLPIWCALLSMGMSFFGVKQVLRKMM
ncbi:MAG: hypothetical protein IJ870_05025 [Alphaproteobacteria bacterium]|nr:hypothetical protein [Alphaproteobacteria bacterium]